MKLSDAKLGDEIIKTNVGNSCYIQKVWSIVWTNDDEGWIKTNTGMEE